MSDPVFPTDRDLDRHYGPESEYDDEDWKAWQEEIRIEAEIERMERREDFPPDINGIQWPYTHDDLLEASGKVPME